MKVVVFGTGNLYQHNKDWIPAGDIVAFIDNDAKKHGKYLDGIKIYSPEYISDISYDKIVIMSWKIEAMRTQLLSMEVPDDMIWTWERYHCDFLRGTLEFFGDHAFTGETKKRILVLTADLDYHGGALAAVHAVQALQLKGYNTVLAAPSGSEKFIGEVVEVGVNVVLCPAVRYLGDVEKNWIRQFDVVIVNVYPMLPCACEIIRFKPVLWWIHEAGMSYINTYDVVREEFPQYDTIFEMQQINIAAVSEIAKANFEVYYPQRVNHILPYGIPDEYISTNTKDISNKLVFSIIGPIMNLKSQKIFMRAVLCLSSDERENCEFLIIGAENSSKYYKEVNELAERIPQVKITGQLTREEMKESYKKIDVVVCASMEETLSMVIVEGMMHGKICITTDATGIADYISNAVNGFICEAGSVESLCQCIKWVIHHKNELQYIKENARKTYEKYFTMEKFGERLEKLIHETEKDYP